MVRIKPAICGVVCVVGMAITGCNGNSGGNEKGEDGSAMKNLAIENIMTRTSIRQYQPGRSIPTDTVETMLRAAMAAPTAVNRQPWAFVVVDDRAVMDSLMKVCPYARMLEHASIAIVTCGNMRLALEGDARDFWIQDVSAATENLLLAAHALGLGAVWTGVYPDVQRVEGVRKALKLPEYVIPLSLVPVGYPATDPEPKDKWDPDKVYNNHWTDHEDTK